MNKQISFEDRGSLDTALAEHVAGLLAQDIERRGAASLAVSGGSTPKGMFAALSKQELPWHKVWITLVDERWVEPDSDDSNELLVRENLLQNAAQSANFVGLKGSGDSASAALEEVTARVAALPLPLSCAVLGMGGDGHTASWFPQASNLTELLDKSNEALLGSCHPVTAPHERITFTLPPILQAGEIILHITGEEKQQVLAEASERRYPIAAITEQQTNPASIWWAP